MKTMIVRTITIREKESFARLDIVLGSVFLPKAIVNPEIAMINAKLMTKIKTSPLKKSGMVPRDPKT